MCALIPLPSILLSLVELAVVLGRSGKAIPAEKAEDYIAGQSRETEGERERWGWDLSRMKRSWWVETHVHVWPFPSSPSHLPPILIYFIPCPLRIGYAVGIDVTARELQTQVRKAGEPWTECKGYDTFTPIR